MGTMRCGVLLAVLGLFSAVVLCVGEPAKPAELPWIKPLLAQGKLEPDRAQLDPGRWRDGGPHRLKTFERLWDDWRQIDATACSTARDFLAAGDSVDKLLVRSLPLLDLKPLPPKSSTPAPADDTLVRALSDLHRHLGKPLTEAQAKELDSKAKDVPPAVGKVAAVILRAVPDALARRKQALAKYGGHE